MPPSPALRQRLQDELSALRAGSSPLIASRLRLREPTRVGLNDGLNVPGQDLPLGASARDARRAARRNAPLRGTVRVLVIVVGFPDAQPAPDVRARMQELFFSTGSLEHGSVREYFLDVSRGRVRIDGEVLEPLVLPRPVTEYAGAENGMQLTGINARTMADDTFAALPDGLDLAPYDNDGNGFVDAFVIVHAGRGAEESGEPADIWSHKWVLPQARQHGDVSVFGYLTIPEDAKLGVCAHELGHLVFGWPDLYDGDSSSRGIGDYCLMAGGSWGLDGLRPVHPSAWCKASQGWAPVSQLSTNRATTIKAADATGRIYRLWQGGAEGDEYFLVESRRQEGYDASLPAAGLLVWHIDDAAEGNTDERHYQVALLQADGLSDLERNRNGGDEGDAYPGSTGARVLDATTTPSTLSYGDAHTCVALSDIADADADGAVAVRLHVRCTGADAHS